VYEERARAWTEAPATLEQLYRQRYRWSYGTMQAMWKHRQALFDGGDSGRFGRRGLPFLALFGVALPMLAPVVDVMLVYGLVFWELTATLTAWFAMLALQLVTAAVAFRFDRESMRPLWKLPLQQFAYRQLMYLVLMQSAMTAMTGGRLRWHKLHRAGLPGAQPAAVPMTGPAAAESAAAVSPAVTGVAPVVALPGEPGFPEQTRGSATGRAVPAQGVAPVVDTWPPVRGQAGPSNKHPASGRAAARPPISRLPQDDSEPSVR
jgi:hypothetical protein